MRDFTSSKVVYRGSYVIPWSSYDTLVTADAKNRMPKASLRGPYPGLSHKLDEYVDYLSTIESVLSGRARARNRRSLSWWHDHGYTGDTSLRTCSWIGWTCKDSRGYDYDISVNSCCPLDPCLDSCDDCCKARSTEGAALQQQACLWLKRLWMGWRKTGTEAVTAGAAEGGGVVVWASYE